MANIEKVIKKLEDKAYVEKLQNEYNDSVDYLKFSFKIFGKPENYVRERTGRGKHFYNPKQKLMENYRKMMLDQLNEDEKIFLSQLRNSEKEYYVALNISYYLPIPKADSIEMTVKKELGIIRPAIRPDLDNYDKFLIDSMHDVLFEDDKRLVNINCEKRYSINPRTEVVALLVVKE